MLKTCIFRGLRGIQLHSKLSINLANIQIYRPLSIEIIKFHKNHHHRQENHGSANNFKQLFITASLWTLITGKEETEETPEDQLIVSIKRGVLSIQRGEYKKAEQILHVSLKMAQDLQHNEGITYIYDILANLALEAGDFEKAEKLFVDVMQRLFGEGYKEDSTKMLHISAKMAHLFHFQGNLDKSLLGFQWTLEKLEEKVKKFPNNGDLIELFGLTKNWCGQLLMDKAMFTEAKKHFEEAYEIYTKIHGEKTEEGIMMLNNLSVACMEMKDLVGAIEFIRRAIKLAEEIPKMTEVGIFHANLGLLYMKQGLVNEAREACKFGRRLGLKLHNDDAVTQADYCIEQLKKVKVD